MGTLSTQLKTSQMEIENSRLEVKALQTLLDVANEFLQNSAQEAKRTQKRIKRQRDTWAVVAAIILGIFI